MSHSDMNAEQPSDALGAVAAGGNASAFPTTAGATTNSASPTAAPDATPEGDAPAVAAASANGGSTDAASTAAASPAPQLKESAPGLLGAPKGMRMGIGLFGRRNVGKSSVLNAITHQQTSIVSDVAGTTTDPVDKAMELLPLGPVLFVDTAGIDDDQDTVGELRTKRTAAVFDRCDVGVIVTEAGTWGPYEDEIAAQLERRDVPTIVVFNKMDRFDAGEHTAAGQSADPLAACRACIPERMRSVPAVCMSAAHNEGVLDFRQALLDNAPEEFVNDPKILGDVVAPGSVVALVIPIDKEAPKGRIILPQVQTIRDLLDSGCMPLCTTDRDLPAALAALAEPPALVVTDSQAFGEVARMVPENVPLTGFSVAFARFKGDLPTQTLGTLAIDDLTEDSRVLIAEACTHHPIEEDIGTVKIPRLLRKRVGQGLTVDHVRGVDFPDDLSSYDLVIHCGGCTFNRRAVLSRIQTCVHAGVPVSNYGLALAYLNGVFDRSIKAFPGMEEFLAARRE